VVKPRPTLCRLCELTPGQFADCFVLLAERTKGATREGKPFYTCRFRDLKRTVSFMVWADGGFFESCENEWRPGQFFKVRGTYLEHERFGPQLDIQQIRAVTEADRGEGFDPAEFVEHSRFNPEEMYAELKRLVEEHIADLPLRRLVLTILERHAVPLKKLPATQRNFYPFPGGLLEHILSVARSCIRSQRNTPPPTRSCTHRSTATWSLPGPSCTTSAGYWS
jgi:3'-5' exoribonuclease